MRADAFASIKKRCAASGVVDTEGCMNLIARLRSVNMFVADHTDAIPPEPMGWLRRYLLAMIWPDCMPVVTRGFGALPPNPWRWEDCRTIKPRLGISSSWS